MDVIRSDIENTGRSFSRPCRPMMQVSGQLKGVIEQVELVAVLFCVSRGVNDAVRVEFSTRDNPSG